MNFKEIGKKAIVPGMSALLGAATVVTFLKFTPAAMAKVSGSAKPERQGEQVYDGIFKKHESIRSQFDSLFNDVIIGQNDPFEVMKKVSGSTINDISKREDDNFVYYDIKIGDLNSTSINTKVEDGYVSISGTEEGAEGKDESSAAQSIFRSAFSRTFPLPKNLDQDKMQMLTEKDKVVLKFPKTKA